MRRSELRKLIEAVMNRYSEYYMDIAAGKTHLFGVGGGSEEDTVVVAGETVQIQVKTMKHLGAVLPLKGEVVLAEKSGRKVETVRLLWEQEAEIPMAVCREQFQAEVLGGPLRVIPVSRAKSLVASTAWRTVANHSEKNPVSSE